MSRDWTPEELQAVSRQMKASGHMSFEEFIQDMAEQSAKALVEKFAEKQQGGHFACPRCGRMAMDAESVSRNATSRRAAVYVCDACGTTEALEDFTGSASPLSKWAIVLNPENWCMQ